jgi:hypothetical protein
VRATNADHYCRPTTTATADAQERPHARACVLGLKWTVRAGAETGRASRRRRVASVVVRHPGAARSSSSRCVVRLAVPLCGRLDEPLCGRRDALRHDPLWGLLTTSSSPFPPLLPLRQLLCSSLNVTGDADPSSAKSVRLRVAERSGSDAPNLQCSMCSAVAWWSWLM